MPTQVIVLNGASSSGKSAISRCLQALLPDPWLTFGIDTLITAMPAAMHSSADGIEIDPHGVVTIGDTFKSLEEAWANGIGAMAHAGARIIVDEVFLGGSASQDRWRTALHGLDVLWVGVHCDGEIARGREIARGDRVPGMAQSQAELVHRGVRYDLVVDTSRSEAIQCAREIASRLG